MTFFTRSLSDCLCIFICSYQDICLYDFLLFVCLIDLFSSVLLFRFYSVPPCIWMSISPIYLFCMTIFTVLFACICDFFGGFLHVFFGDYLAMSFCQSIYLLLFGRHCFVVVRLWPFCQCFYVFLSVAVSLCLSVSMSKFKRSLLVLRLSWKLIGKSVKHFNIFKSCT